MKKITLFFLMSLNIVCGQTTLFDFDAVNANHVFLEAWNGTWPNTAFAKVANPNVSGINTSSYVGKFIANGGANAELKSEDVGTGTSTIVSQFDFTATPYFVLKVWVNKAVDVSIEFRNTGYYPSFVKKTKKVTTINQWVEVVFDCSDLVSGGAYGWGTYDRFGVYFDTDLSGGTVANDVYYFDDIRLSSTTSLSNEDFTTNSEFEYYPNPALDYIIVKDVQKVTIMNMNGCIVKEAFNVGEKVDVSSLAKGVYIIKFQNENVTKIGKLIKK